MTGDKAIVHTDLHPFIEEATAITRALVKGYAPPSCPVCHYVPQSWRNPQPRVPRIVTWRGQERPGTESADESPREAGETA